MSDKIAIFIKDFTGSSKFSGDAKLYRLSEKVGYDWDWDTEIFLKHTEYVIVSALRVAFSGPETYIFPADHDGNVISWCELGGSFKGELNHERALHNIGFLIAKGE